MSIFPSLRLSPIGLLSALLFLFLSPSPAHAEGFSPPIWSPPVAFSCKTGFLGDCARSDAIGVHLGTTSAMRFTGDRRFAGLSGWVDGSLTFLDLVTVGGAIGGHFGRDEAGTTSTASSPAMLFAKLNFHPAPWQKAANGGLQLAVSYQRSFASERLGRDEPPGFDMNTVRLLASRSFGPVDLDAGVGASFGGAEPDLRRYVEGSLTAGLRIYGLVKPLEPDEQLRVSIQGLYRFALPGTGGPSEGYVLLGVHEQTTGGYGFGFGIGPQFLGSHVGGLFMVKLSVSWGLRYRNPWAESIAGRRRIPRTWMDLFYIDPILREDGCVYTEPARGIEPVLLTCLGTPDPQHPGQIRLYSGGYVRAQRLWADDDGTLLDQDGMHVGKISKLQLPLALAAQELAKKLREREKAEGQPCAYRADMLHGVHDWGLKMAVAGDDHGGATALIAAEIGRAIQCGDPKTLAGNGFLPLLGRLAPKKGPVKSTGSLIGHGESEHVEPPIPAQSPQTPFNLLTGSEGLIGTEFEKFLVKQLGGSGSFKAGKREFDGCVGNRWWEAKSGRYWDDVVSTPEGWSDFTSTIGEQAAIAKRSGATFELFSNTRISSRAKEWLSKRGIPFTEPEPK